MRFDYQYISHKVYNMLKVLWKTIHSINFQTPFVTRRKILNIFFIFTCLTKSLHCHRYFIIPCLQKREYIYIYICIQNEADWCTRL